jgi:hypothetical protein
MIFTNSLIKAKFCVKQLFLNPLLATHHDDNAPLR